MVKEPEYVLTASLIMNIKCLNIFFLNRENVRKQIMYFIASTFKYSTKQKQQWPELFKFMQELIVSSSPDQHLVSRATII